MEYLGDTNIYRNLVRGLGIPEIKILAEKINDEESNSNIKSGISIVVAMELISHLHIDDLNHYECYKALCLLFHHSKKLNIEKKKYSGQFYPPIDIILTSYFFNENSEYLEKYSQVLGLTKVLTENYDINNINLHSKQIDIVKKQLIYEKKKIKDNYEIYLSTINNNLPDWEYFKKNKTHRKEWFKSLRSGKTSFFFAEGLMIRAFNLTNRDYIRNEENFEKLIKFINHFYPAILMHELLLEQLGNGNASLSDIDYVKWNTINDISIMFGMLLFSERDNKVLITEDKAIRRCLNDNGKGNNVLSLDEFKIKMSI